MEALAVSHPGRVVSLETEQTPEIAREFEQRLAECSALAFRVALGVLRNRADAEEVAQEAFLRAYRNFHRLRERERFRAWLARITWRLALDRLRATGRRERREIASMDPSPSPSVEDLAGSHEFQQHLAQAMDELPEKLRLALILAAIEGYNLQEVSRLLDVPAGTVKSRVHLARKRLAERLRWLVSATKKDF
jgi:RNA polymerase sigma-70 factor (ECF subfamily)